MSEHAHPEAPVVLAVSDGVATITLNRPTSLNAFDADTAEAWAQAAGEAVARHDVRAIVVQGAGRAFCAGGDVRAMAALHDREAEMTALAHRINDGILALVESTTPVVAAAHGTTAGGGLGILLASDYAVVGASSKIGSIYSAMALTPDLSVSALLARAVGERRALQLVLQERMLTPAEALDWGLVAEVVDAPDAPDAADAENTGAEYAAVRDRASAIARHWASGAATAYGEAKRLIRSQPTRTLREQLAEEARSIGAASVTADADARIRAFAAR